MYGLLRTDAMTDIIITIIIAAIIIVIIFDPFSIFFSSSFFENGDFRREEAAESHTVLNVCLCVEYASWILIILDSTNSFPTFFSPC